MVRKGTSVLRLVSLLAAVGTIGWAGVASAGEQPETEVVARVNGEPIYRKDVAARDKSRPVRRHAAGCD